LDKNKSNFF